MFHTFPHLQDENGVLDTTELRTWESGAFETEAAMMTVLQEADKESEQENRGSSFFFQKFFFSPGDLEEYDYETYENGIGYALYGPKNIDLHVNELKNAFLNA